ncbi:MAG: hypothetical protein FJZ16_07345 [Candidatus Omnitrophica bacterium]|nr:hypothetical protein [Candidatus Omnitrophota bacterium]
MAKKNKKKIAKRRAKSNQIKSRKKKLRLVKSRREPDVQVMYRPGIADMGAPPGFRAINMSQAVLEYGKPLEQYVKMDSKDGLNISMQSAMLLWNYANSVQRGEEDEKEGKDIIDILKRTFKLEYSEAHDLVKRMVERFDYLFPLDKQPKERFGPFMFIRKEISTIIRPFDYSTLKPSNEIIPPDEKDRELIERINKLDSYVKAEADYEEYENLLLELKEECMERFKKWLADKRLSEEIISLYDCINIYFDFIYGYMHDDIALLKSVPSIYFEEFFKDFLLRKMYVEPNEYVYWPPALKLFYKFLHEKNYLENPDNFIKEIDYIEFHFIEVLRKQFT